MSFAEMSNTSAWISVQETQMEEPMDMDVQICLVGKTGTQEILLSALKKLNMPYVISDSGKEYLRDEAMETVHVVDEFEGHIFMELFVQGARILGPPVIIKQAEQDESKIKRKRKLLPFQSRPLYCQHMQGTVVCFTGFLKKAELKRLGELVHHMGGSIRKDMTSSVTHLVANATYGQKYRYAVGLGKPILTQEWINTLWGRRCELNIKATDDAFMADFKVPPFFSCILSFIGFSDTEQKHMEEQTVAQGGKCAAYNDPSCTHVVIEENTVKELPSDLTCRKVVKQEWFWACIQIDACADEILYIFDKMRTPMTFVKHTPSTPSRIQSGKKRRLKDSIAALSEESDRHETPLPPRKRRSSMQDGTNLMSISSSSILDATQTPDSCGGDTEAADTPSGTKFPAKSLFQKPSKRQLVAMELIQTETNYVRILETIIKVFKEPLEQEQTGGPILAQEEMKVIFNKIPDIYDVHRRLRDDLDELLANYSDQKSIGAIIVKHAQDMMRAYPPFVNFFEMAKETVAKCDKEKPRFHAFLKICQSKPECGRQSLTELLIRPVQRPPSMILLLTDLLKKTDQSHPDHAQVQKALESLKKVSQHINEDKRKTESHTQMFDIINDIEGVPPHLLSAHRTFIQKVEVVEIADQGAGKGDNFSERGSCVSMLLFSDMLEICKRRGKYASSHKSPHATAKHSQKTHKHIELLPLSHIRRVLDVLETEACQEAFALLCKPLMDSSSRTDRLYIFTLTSTGVSKTEWLKTLCQHIATTLCRTDADSFLTSIEPEELEISKSDSKTINRAVKAAKKATKKVGRTFSFNKTPRQSVNNAVSNISGIFSPVATGEKLTPQQLEKMGNKLAGTMTLKSLSPLARRTPLTPRQLKSLTLGPSTLKKY